MQHSRQKQGRWRLAQRKESAFWRKPGVLDTQMQRVLSRYDAVIGRLSLGLKADSTILDVGCGPTCVGRLFRVGSKTYLDPLMDLYLRTYPDGLPEGEKICAPAESIPKEDETFDVVICVNALDHVRDPGQALSEMKRVLKKGGLFVLGVYLHPPLIAAARRFTDKWSLIFRDVYHPYSYTLKSARKLLGRAFLIQSEVSAFRKERALIPSLHREDRLFICRKAS